MLTSMWYWLCVSEVGDVPRFSVVLAEGSWGRGGMQVNLIHTVVNDATACAITWRWWA